ncbi:sulfhydryl oxidase 1-like [Iris pallida]|uniref:Sulfhydryl oxidase 1-like n=1 Tax=Iris pallida TaxID=29817 RepID=A0AAX6G1Z8_IRIPA|nr:sulfhydryl oxidase 1-like [Iris pallida]
MSPIFLSLLLLLFSHSSDSRSIADVPVLSSADAAVDLNSSTFEDFFKKSPADFAIVEFFAHWCPACRNYKLHYEKVARLFNGPGAVHPGIIVMTRVDCADKTNTDLCDRFSVSRYPMLLWGPPIKFAAGRWDPKKQNNEIQSIDDGRTAEDLLNWINKRIGRQLI